MVWGVRARDAEEAGDPVVDPCDILVAVVGQPRLQRAPPPLRGLAEVGVEVRDVGDLEGGGGCGDDVGALRVGEERVDEEDEGLE